MIELIKIAHQIINKELIIEVNEFDINTSNESSHRFLQTISTADIINKQLRLKEIKLRKLPIILSVGNTSCKLKLAKQCGVSFNGITFETDLGESFDYLGKKYSELSNKEIISAIERAKNLIKNDILT